MQFENLICNNLDLLIRTLGLAKQDIIFAGPYFQRKTVRQQALQIDYLIQLKQDVVYICEIKFSRKLVAMPIIDAMKEKAKRLTLPKYISRRFVLIHVNDVSDSVVDEQFFDHIIDFGEFLQMK